MRCLENGEVWEEHRLRVFENGAEEDIWTEEG
jgi:hypothetical protein